MATMLATAQAKIESIELPEVVSIDKNIEIKISYANELNRSADVKIIAEIFHDRQLVDVLQKESAFLPNASKELVMAFTPSKSGKYIIRITALRENEIEDMKETSVLVLLKRIETEGNMTIPLMVDSLLVGVLCIFALILRRLK